MAQLLVRNLDDDVKARLRVRAAEHGRSMTDEVRVILRQAVEADQPGALPLPWDVDAPAGKADSAAP